MKIKFSKSGLRKRNRHGERWAGSQKASIVATISEVSHNVDVYVVDEEGKAMREKHEVAVVRGCDGPYVCASKLVIDERYAYALVITNAGEPSDVLRVEEIKR